MPPKLMWDSGRKTGPAQVVASAMRSSDPQMLDSPSTYLGEVALLVAPLSILTHRRAAISARMNECHIARTSSDENEEGGKEILGQNR
jgi:hypothetical protein